jgi:hypothetical protein
VHDVDRGAQELDGERFAGITLAGSQLGGA